MQESLRQTPTNEVSAALILQESQGRFDTVDLLRELQGQMLEASQQLEYEKAALLRDQINELKKQLGIDKITPRETLPKGGSYRGGKGKRKK